MTIYKKMLQYISVLANCHHKKNKANDFASDNKAINPSNYLPDKNKGYMAAKEFKKKYPNAFKKLGE